MFMGPIMELQLLIIYQHITIMVHMAPRCTIHMAMRNTIHTMGMVLMRLLTMDTTIQDPMGNMDMAMPILIMELITMTIKVTVWIIMATMEVMTLAIMIQDMATEDIMVKITDTTTMAIMSENICLILMI